MKSTFIFACFGAVLLSESVGIAEAQPANTSTNTIQMTVSSAGLDLTMPAGRAALDRRIRRAAADLCGPATEGVNQLDVSIRFKACIDKAVADAVGRQPAAATVASRDGHAG